MYQLRARAMYQLRVRAMYQLRMWANSSELWLSFGTVKMNDTISIDKFAGLHKSNKYQINKSQQSLVFEEYFHCFTVN